MAKTEEALTDLQRQFHDRLTRKQYLAMVRNVPALRCGTVDLPIGRHPVDRKRRMVNGEAPRDAVTHYEVESALAEFAAKRAQDRRQ